MPGPPKLFPAVRQPQHAGGVFDINDLQQIHCSKKQLLILLFFAFKVPVVLSNVVLFSMLIFGVLALFLDYFRKKSFYNTFLLMQDQNSKA